MIVFKAGKAEGKGIFHRRLAAAGSRDFHYQPVQPCKFPLFATVRDAIKTQAPGALAAFDAAVTEAGLESHFLGNAGLASNAAHRPRAVRRKLVNALVKGAASNLDTRCRRRADSANRNSASPRPTPMAAIPPVCRVDTGGPDYLICDLGSGARDFATAARLPGMVRANRRPITSLVSHGALGPHHGLSVLCSLLHTGQQDPDLQLPRAAWASHPGAKS